MFKYDMIEYVLLFYRIGGGGGIIVFKLNIILFLFKIYLVLLL